MEEVMNALVSTLANGTVQVWEAAAVVAAAVAIQATPREPRRKQSAKVDCHTLKDLGVEPGSITWLR